MSPCVKAMRATLLEKALEKCFRRAGGAPVRQPSTYSLLGGHFTKDDLSRLFSGRLNTKQATERKELAMKYLDIMKLPRGHIRTTQLGILRDSFPDAVVGGEDENNGMIRFDMKLPLITPTDKPRAVVGSCYCTRDLSYSCRNTQVSGGKDYESA